MTCNETAPLLQIYLDNELSPVDARAVEDHLRLCPGCTGEASAFRRVDALLTEVVEKVDPDAGPFGDCMRETFATAPSRRASRWVRLAAAAGLVLVPLAGWAVYERAKTLVYREAVDEHLRAERTGAGALAPGPELDSLVARLASERPAAHGVAGQRLLGGHRCHVGDILCAHLLYATTDGRVISVFVGRQDGDLADHVEETDGEIVVAAANGGVRSIVVGDADAREDVLRTFDAFR
jgi:anti-sigma factor RsiW